jgi:hypothetical protein
VRTYRFTMLANRLYLLPGHQSTERRRCSTFRQGEVQHRLAERPQAAADDHRSHGLGQGVQRLRQESIL